MIKAIMFNFVLFISTTVSLAGNERFPYRHSGDFTSIYIYLSTNVAIAKSTPDIGNEPVTSYQIGKSHFLNEPELAISTGDVMDKVIISFPKKVGLSENGKWLLVVGDDFNDKEIMSSNHVWLVSLVSERIIPAIYMEVLTSKWKTYNVPNIPLPGIKLEPTGVFFDRHLIESLSQN